MMKRFIGLLLWSFLITGYAEPPSFPEGCEPFLIEKDSITLQAKSPQLILFYNQSSSNLWITHPITEPSASAGWSSQLEPGNWTMLALDKDAFELSCIESNPGHEQQVSCVDKISACNWSKLNTVDPKPGTYWLGENKSLERLKAQLVSQGYKLPLSTK